MGQEDGSESLVSVRVHEFMVCRAHGFVMFLLQCFVAELRESRCWRCHTEGQRVEGITDYTGFEEQASVQRIELHSPSQEV